MLETGVGQSDGKLLTPCRTFCGLRLGCKRWGRCKVLRSIAGGWISFKFRPGRHDAARGTVSRVLDALCSIPRRLCCLSSNTLRPGRTQYPSYPSTNAVSNDTKVPNQMASVGDKKAYPQQTSVTRMQKSAQSFSPVSQVPDWRPSRPNRLGDVAMSGKGRATAATTTARAKTSEASILVDFFVFGEGD